MKIPERKVGKGRAMAIEKHLRREGKNSQADAFVKKQKEISNIGHRTSASPYDLPLRRL